MTQNIPLSKIVLSKDNPRKAFCEKELSLLSASIKAFGVLEPVLVTPKKGKYELVFGERRVRACQNLGLSEIPAMVQDLSADKVHEIRLVENLQRADLNPLEEAQGFEKLRKLGLSLEEISDRASKPKPFVEKRLALLELQDTSHRLVYTCSKVVIGLVAILEEQDCVLDVVALLLPRAAEGKV